MAAEVKRIGYKNPPLHTRWQKGECGNPDRKRVKREKSLALMIDEGFFKKIKILDAGVPRIVTNFEAIMLQLSNKAIKGDKRAQSVYLGYRKLASQLSGRREIEIQIVPDEDSDSDDTN